MDKKVALYCRVSTGAQTNENQRIRLLQYVTDRNLPFDLFEEKESTRKTRPVKQQLLVKLRKGEYHGVIVHRLDRWARSTSELLLEIDEFIKKGIGFISISDNLDFTTAAGRLHLTILSAFCQFERDLISQRTREGLVRARLQGKRPGRPKGRKDSKPRKKSGYILREARKRQKLDQEKGLNQPIEAYV